jgi:hypothetical protein
MLAFSAVGIYFAYIVSFGLGIIPILYLGKIDKKQLLQINLISSLIVAIIVVLVYFFYLRSLSGLITVDNLPGFITLIDVNNFLLKILVSLVIFNIPGIIYFFFGKEIKK